MPLVVTKRTAPTRATPATPKRQKTAPTTKPQSTPGASKTRPAYTSKNPTDAPLLGDENDPMGTLKTTVFKAKFNVHLTTNNGMSTVLNLAKTARQAANPDYGSVLYRGYCVRSVRAALFKAGGKLGIEVRRAIIPAGFVCMLVLLDLTWFPSVAGV
jgi:hypothetical protein